MSLAFDWRATLVLPPDVEIVEVNRTDAEVRDEIADTGDEYIVHRRGAREAAKVIDPDAVRLLEAFRQPRKVVDAVIALSRASGIAADQLLDECFPLLAKMVDDGMLAVAGSDSAARLAPSFAAGDSIAGWIVAACVRLIDDSEVYRAQKDGRVAAIKVLRRRGIERGLDALLSREADVLSRLDGTVTPRLYESRPDHSPPWIAVEWRQGIRPDECAPDRRLPVGLAIADAYAALHGQGVLHGDVHPGNIVVDEGNQVTLLDFALARIPGDSALDRVMRGAVQGYWEPEFAASMLRGRGEVPLTFAGEQYAVATLVDRLLTGEPALRMPAVERDHWHAITDGIRRCFAERGRPAWPSLERVLRRAMAREPGRRYESVAAFADALRGAARTRRGAIAPAPDSVGALLEQVLPGGELFEQGVVTPPLSSFNFGAAGIAFALYRIARARDDGELLAAAELWQRRAEIDCETPNGLYDVGEFEQTELGDVSPYHARPGVWFTRALLCRAIGQPAACDRAIREYASAIDHVDARAVDLTLGQTAALLGAAILYAARPTPALRDVGDRLLESAWERLRLEPPIRDARGHGYLGIAHGWAGYVYGALMWARATATPPPAVVVTRLEQILEIVDTDEGRWRVPVAVPGHALGRDLVRHMDGWCHGQAGHVFLRLLAATVLGGTRLVEEAARLGESAFAGSEQTGNLCCGLAGRAYAMLALYRATGEPIWLDRARDLVARSADGSGSDRWPNSLYKGRVGIAVAAAEIDRPDLARMPAFEDEGWL